MTITIKQLTERIEPSKTSLLLGSGSSMSSGAPSVKQLHDHLTEKFSVTTSSLSLPDLALLIENRYGRKKLISAVRERFEGLEPTGALLCMPRHGWKSLYTTNFDNLIEQSFERENEPISVLSSDFDFRTDEIPNAIRLMKLHGSIDKDISDGFSTRLVITRTDFELARKYRTHLFRSLGDDLDFGDLIIIGHSLSDPDIDKLINESVRSRTEAHFGSIFLLMFEKSEELAEVYEILGLTVCFGGIEDFFALVAQKPQLDDSTIEKSDSPLSVAPYLSPITIDVSHRKNLRPEVSEMFNGRPAEFADIRAGYTFERSVTNQVENLILQGDKVGCILLGAAGVGKTTAARQILLNLHTHYKFFAWEHQSDHTLVNADWVRVAKCLKDINQRGILLVNDCDEHLFELNSLFDEIVGKELKNLYVIMTSAPHQWNHRIKSPLLSTNTKVISLEKLNKLEVDKLIALTKHCTPIRELIETEFLHFSEEEQTRRLLARCERDVFVCLKNVFATEKFDDILLHEFASLEEDYRNIYKTVAALEDSGVRVHRQLIMRILGIESTRIATILDSLTGIIKEYTIKERDGIYGWKLRHSVIAHIISKYNHVDLKSFEALFERVITDINPTYDIEVRTIIGLSSSDNGLRKLNLITQNRLLAKMISIAPGERVPRHRLVNNLIEMKEFGRAEREIKMFKNDFNEDGPIYRYRIVLKVERAKDVEKLLLENRLVILNEAALLAKKGIRRYPHNKYMLYTYCDVGIEIYKQSNDKEILDDAFARLKKAEKTFGDKEISHKIIKFEKQILNIT